jgi:acyl-[acyl-carrier-protein]-phospholipid O-acyltransferase / long-chain-fatty-acid--[acyl-carrier-protein] ligase
MADATTPHVSFIGALTRSILMARRLKSVWANQTKVGLLLPPSVGGALANWAALLSGKVPVNLNYTLTESAIASCVQQCELQTVLTSRMFLEKAKFPAPPGAVYLEDIFGKNRPGTFEKLGAMLRAWFVPTRWLERSLGAPPRSRDESLDSLATIIFPAAAPAIPKA